MLQHNFQCQLHDPNQQFPIDHICAQKDCPARGAICSQCLKDSHASHTTFTINQYLEQMKVHQISDADNQKLIQAYSILINGVSQLKQIYMQILTSFETFLYELHNKHKQDIDQQRNFQRDQAKYLTLLDRSTNLKEFSLVVLQLINFSNENKLLERYELIREFLPRVIQASQNFSTETPKMSKDLTAYFRQLQKYMVPPQSNQSSRVVMSNCTSKQQRRVQSQDMRGNEQKGQTSDKKVFESSQVFQYPSIIIEKNQEDATFGGQHQKQEVLQSNRDENWFSQRDIMFSPEKEEINDIQPYSRNHNFFKEKNIFTNNLNLKSRILQSKQKSQESREEYYEPNQNLRALLNLKDSPPPSNHLNSNFNSNFNSHSNQQQSAINSSQKSIIQSDFNSNSNSNSNNTIFQQLLQLGNSQNIYSSQSDISKKNHNTKLKLITNVNDGPISSIINTQTVKEQVEIDSFKTFQFGKVHDTQITEIVKYKNTIQQLILNEKNIVTCAQDGQVIFWDAISRKQFDKIILKSSVASCCKFQDKSTEFIALGIEDGSLTIVQKVNKKWQHFQAYNLFQSPIVKIIFISQQRGYLYVFSQQGEFKYINIISSAETAAGISYEDDQQAYTNDAYINVVESTLKLNLKMVLGGGKKSGLLTFWSCENQKDWKREHQLKAHNKTILKILKCNQYLVTIGMNEHDIKFWDFGTYQLYYTIREQQQICSLQIDPHSNYLWVGTFDKISGKGRVNLWNGVTHLLIQDIGNYNTRPTKISISHQLIGIGFLSNELIAYQY